jgi:hypothetical protein
VVDEPTTDDQPTRADTMTAAAVRTAILEALSIAGALSVSGLARVLELNDGRIAGEARALRDEGRLKVVGANRHRKYALPEYRPPFAVHATLPPKLKAKSEDSSWWITEDFYAALHARGW